MVLVKMVNTIKIFQRICIRIEFGSQRIEIFLFLTTNIVTIERWICSIIFSLL